MICPYNLLFIHLRTKEFTENEERFLNDEKMNKHYKGGFLLLSLFVIYPFLIEHDLGETSFAKPLLAVTERPKTLFPRVR